MLIELYDDCQNHLTNLSFQDVNTCGDGDPFYETIGLITLEDIIEEIIQQEIIDETDIYIDNRTKKRRMKNGKLPIDLPMFLEHPRKVNVSQQLTLAVFQYLTTTIEPFKSKHMSDIVLKKLLTMDVFRYISLFHIRITNNVITFIPMNADNKI